ncbi:hypothetical protein SSBG_01763 [Streptomyces sp. SPB074]|nr:hypothetical protein SSBG_01763 [Streptomyces sp. SPB074]
MPPGAGPVVVVPLRTGRERGVLMDNDKKALILLVVVLVCGIVTYVAFLHPPLGLALGVGIAAAALVWAILRQE